MKNYILKFKRNSVQLLDIETGYLYETSEKINLFKHFSITMLCALLGIVLSIIWYYYFELILLNSIICSICIGINCALWIYCSLDNSVDLTLVRRLPNSKLNNTRVDYIRLQLFFAFLYLLKLVFLQYEINTCTMTFLKFLLFLIFMSLDIFVFTIFGKYMRFENT